MIKIMPPGVHRNDHISHVKIIRILNMIPDNYIARNIIVCAVPSCFMQSSVWVRVLKRCKEDLKKYSYGILALVVSLQNLLLQRRAIILQTNLTKSITKHLAKSTC